jgi:hypothetical protein
VAWAASQFDGKTVRFDNNRYYGTGYESTRRGTNGSRLDDGNNRFMWGWPSGWSSDPNNIWSWAERRYSGFDDFRLRSGQEAHASLNDTTPPSPPPTSVPPVTTPPTITPPTTTPTVAPPTSTPTTTPRSPDAKDADDVEEHDDDHHGEDHGDHGNHEDHDDHQGEDNDDADGGHCAPLLTGSYAMS